MKPLRSKDRAKLADDAAIAASTWFTVIHFIGRSGREPGPVSAEAQRLRWDFRAEDYGGDRAAALEAARRAKLEAGRDPYGRGAMIYAVTASNATIFVE